MAGRITALTETQIIYDIREDLRRRRVNLGQQTLTWTYDRFVAPATYQLTYLPYGINVLADNGSVLAEGTDYTVDYTTGLITFGTGRTSGHVIYVSYVTTGDLIAASGPADTGGPILSLVQQSSAPSRGAATLSISNTLGSAVTAGSLVVCTFWNATGDAVNNTVSGLSGTWSYSRGGQWGAAWCVAPGGSSTVTLSIAATRTMAMMVYELSPSQAITSVTGTDNSATGPGPAAAISDTITATQTVADFFAILGTTTAPTSYNDLLPALAWHHLAASVDATDTLQFGGAVPTAGAAGSVGIAPTTPASGVTGAAQWQLVVT